MQTIPIRLTASTPPVSIQATDFAQLLTLISQYMSGQIQDDVTFVQTGASDPTQFVTLLFFNTSQGVFKYWDTGAGRYLAVTQFIPGDVKNSFVAGDEIQQGWILLDGRLISSIQGISQDQASVLEILFGLGGSLPTVTPLQSLAGLPANSAFSSITISDILPPVNQIGNLPFSGSYDPGQSQALATNTETLRGSTSSLKDSVASIRTVSASILAALNGTGPATLYAKVFAGYPT